jgi:hypothetical protein
MVSFSPHAARKRSATSHRTAFPTGLVQITREAKAIRERGERVSLGEEQGLLARNVQFAGAVQHTRFEVMRKRRKVAIRGVEFERLRRRIALPGQGRDESLHLGVIIGADSGVSAAARQVARVDEIVHRIGPVDLFDEGENRPFWRAYPSLCPRDCAAPSLRELRSAR